MLQSSANAASINMTFPNLISDLVTAVNNLSSVVARLSDALSNRTPSVLPHQASTAPVPNPKTYSSALKSNGINTNSHYAKNVRTTNIKSDDFMAKLIELKNLRNDAVYKEKRNEMIANIYADAIAESPMKIPKKFYPKINKSDQKEIADHKMKIAVDTVHNDINLKRLHKDIHANRVNFYDKKVREHIKEETNSVKQEKLLKDYLNITNRYDQNLKKKFETKRCFLQSGQHLYTVKTLINNIGIVSNFSKENGATMNPGVNVNNQYFEDVDIDDISPFSLPEENNHAIQAYNFISTPSPNETRSRSPTSPRQGNPFLTQPEAQPNSKNEQRPPRRERMKSSTQN